PSSRPPPGVHQCRPFGGPSSYRNSSTRSSGSSTITRPARRNRNSWDPDTVVTIVTRPRPIPPSPGARHGYPAPGAPRFRGNAGDMMAWDDALMREPGHERLADRGPAG